MDLSRRDFLKAAGLTATSLAVRRSAGAAVPLPRDADRYSDGEDGVPGGVKGEPERVVVIGAGFAGLAVANALRNAGVECVVLEGRDRIGGRAHTASVGGAPVDLGCSWITDPIGNPMTRFATRSGVAQTNAAIELDVPTSRFYDERTGIVLPPGTLRAASHAELFDEESGTIAAKLGRNASIKDGIEYYADEHNLRGDARRRGIFFMRVVAELTDATDWDKDSLWWWANAGSAYYGVGQGDFPRGGYRRIVESLAGGADVRLGVAVDSIEYGTDGVRVHTTDGAGRAATFSGSHAVVSVPLGVLKARSISFDPGLPAAKLAAVDRLGFGTFEKIAMRFPEPYWATEHTHIFHLSDPEAMSFPLIVDYFHLEQVPILVAFNTGRHAIALDGLTDDQAKAAMLDVLRRVQGGPIPEPTDAVVTRWGRDPFANGSYSYLAVGASPRDQLELRRPVGGRLLFAGEATSTTRWGYADGALTSGIREAKRLLRQHTVVLRPS